MPALTLHLGTEQKVKTVRSALPHALLLSGKVGAGLGTLARELAGKELLTLVEPLDVKGQANHETGTIKIAAIRELYDQTRAKSTTEQVVIVDDADRMSLGAQAAFLKLLEEPGEHIHFLLTSHTPKRLLPTIRSRVQTINIEPMSSEQTKQFIESLGVSDQKMKVQLEYLATGLPAELTRLAGSADYFTQRAATMADTRTFLTGTSYQKLLIVHAYYQDRAKALQLIDSALVVTERSLHVKPQQNLIEQLRSLLEIREKIEANYNIRLQLMTFVV